MLKATKVIKIFGIDVKLHFSWWFIFFLLTWSLASSFFPSFFPGYTTTTYWVMGVLSALLLFVSVLLHELSHSLVALYKGIKVKSITLFFFGGVAGIEEEDLRPGTEFMMAIAGPLFSLFLASVFYLIFKLNGNGILTAITFYLYQLNLILAIFNLVPGYPLDGGRAFRAILYAYYKDLRKATKIASFVGKIFAWFLIVMGGFGLVSGLGGGLWFILIGAFIYFIAKVSNEQVVVKEVLSKIAVKDLMVKKIPVIKSEMNFSLFVKRYLRADDDIFSVDGKGILDISRIQKISPKLQKTLKVKNVTLPLEKVRGLTVKDNAYTAFKAFSEQDLGVLPIKDRKKVIGYLKRSTVMRRLVWELKYKFS